MATLREMLIRQEKISAAAPLKIRMNAYKEQLKNSDYKIIKCVEYSLANMPAPYDITELHGERQNLRDQINALEEEIASVEQE